MCRPTVAVAQLWSPEQVVAAEPLDKAEAPVLPLAEAPAAEVESAAVVSELLPAEATPLPGPLPYERRPTKQSSVTARSERFVALLWHPAVELAKCLHAVEVRSC